MRKLHNSLLFGSFYFSVLCVITSLLFGELIFLYWIGNKLNFDYIMFSLFGLTLIAQSVWYSSYVTLVATNKHEKVSFIYIPISILTLISGFLFSKLGASVSFFPISILFGDIIFISIVIKYSLSQINETYKSLLKTFTVFIK
jgi:hypothetical protein